MTTHHKTVLLTVGVVCGISVGEFFLFATELFIVFFALSFFQGALYLVSKKNNKESFVALFFFIISIGIAVGILRFQFVEEKGRILCDSVCDIKGTVVNNPLLESTYQVADVFVNDQSYYIRVRLPLYPTYSKEDTVHLLGKVTIPKNSYPHEKDKSFDYVTYLLVKGVGSEMFYPKVISSTSSKESVTAKLAHIRSHFETRIKTYIKGTEGILSSGMLLGSVSFNDEEKEKFRIAGLTHIVVLSGFNITILIIFALLLLRPLPIVLRVFVATFFILTFITMVGASIPLIRATIMAAFTLVALIFGRGYIAKQALIISLLVIALTSPSSLLYDASLHLSFLATAGIVYMYKPVCILFLRVPKYIQEILSSSVCAYVATLPYVMFTFGSFSMYGIVSNLLVLPVIPLSMLLTASTLCASYIHESFAFLVGYVAHLVTSYILFISSIVTHIPFAYSSISVTLLAAVSMYFGIFLVSFFLVTCQRKLDNETQETKQEDGFSSIIRF